MTGASAPHPDERPAGAGAAVSQALRAAGMRTPGAGATGHVAAGNGQGHILFQEMRFLRDLTDMTCLATIRTTEPDDCTALAELHAEAWRFAYRGIIPGVTLERMIARRGPAWWGSRCGPRRGALVIDFDRRIAGYTLFGGCRTISNRRMGEIAELYVRPECHGAGFGRSLFDEARRRLRARGLRALLVWALSDNDCACAFYSAMGGQERLRTFETLGGVRLEKVGFVWA